MWDILPKLRLNEKEEGMITKDSKDSGKNKDEDSAEVESIFGLYGIWIPVTTAMHLKRVSIKYSLPPNTFDTLVTGMSPISVT